MPKTYRTYRYGANEAVREREGYLPLDALMKMLGGRLVFPQRRAAEPPRAPEPERKPLHEWLRYFDERFGARPEELNPPPAPSLATALAAKPEPRAFIGVAPPDDPTPAMRAASAAQYDAERAGVPAAPSLIAAIRAARGAKR